MLWPYRERGRYSSSRVNAPRSARRRGREAAPWRRGASHGSFAGSTGNLSLESLEGRQLLAITASQDPTTGIVTFSGDSAQDTLTLDMPASIIPAVAPATAATITLNWSVNNVSKIAFMDVTGIKFTDGGNNDTLDFQGSGSVAVLLDGQNITYGGATAATGITLQSVTVPELILATRNTGPMQVGGSGFSSVKLQPGAGVSNAKGLVTNDLVIDGSGNFFLNDATNAFGTVRATAKTSAAMISIRDADGFRVDGIDGSGSGSAGEVTLVSAGGITQAGPIVSNSLRADTSPGSGSIDLTEPSNDFAALSAASTSGNISIVSNTSSTLTIGVGSQGIGSAGGSVDIKATNAGISLVKAANVGTGTLVLTAENGISTAIPQSVGDAITAASLSLINFTTGDIALGSIGGGSSTPRIAVGLLAASNLPGNVSVRNSGALSIGGFGLTVDTGNIDIQSDSISIDAPIFFGNGTAGTVTLNAAGGISQTASGTISDLGLGGTLVVGAAGSNVVLTNTSGSGNQVTKFKATTTGGSVQYTSSGSVAITGILAAGGNIDLHTVNGATIDSSGGAIATTGSGTITLAADVGGNVITGSITAGTGLVLLQANSTGSSIDTSAAAITTAGGGVSIKLLGAGGAITTGDVSTAGGGQTFSTVTGFIDTTAGTLNSGAGAIALSTGADGTITVASISSNGGSQSFTSGAAFNLAAGSLSSNGGTITVTANNAGGTITADPGTSIKSNGGAIRLDANAATVDAIKIEGIASAGVSGRLTLASGGGISDNGTGTITAGQLVVEDASNVVSLTQANNIGSLALLNRSAAANNIVSKAQNLTIGVAGVATPGISTAGGNVSIDNTGHTLGAIAAAVVDTGGGILTLEANAISLETTAHRVGKLAASATGTAGIAFQSAGDLAVVSGTKASDGSAIDGISAPAGGAQIKLTAAGSITQDLVNFPDATILAGNGTTNGKLIVSAASISLKNPANDVFQLQVNCDGRVDYVDATDLSVGVNGLAGAPNKAGGSFGVTLEALDGNILQFAAVYATNLITKASGSIALGTFNNDVDTFAARSGASTPIAPVGITFSDANDVTLLDLLADGTRGKVGYVIVKAGGSISLAGELTYDTATPGSLVLQHGKDGKVDFIVSSTADLSLPTDLTSAAAALTLRQRINYLNDNAVIAPQQEIISFQIDKFFPISIDTLLPTIQRKVTIGPDAAVVTDPDYRIAIDGSNAFVPQIDPATGNPVTDEITGLPLPDTTTAVPGLTFGFGNVQGLGSNGSVIQGLAIYGFSGSGIVLNSSGNTVTNCWVGITRGSEVKGNGGLGGAGIEIVSSLNAGTTVLASSNTVDGNVISGNFNAGIAIRDQATRNAVSNNLIGTNQYGTIPIGNGGYGIEITSSNLNTIGGIGQGNTIANNTAGGLKISGALTSGSDFLANGVRGNTIRNNLGSGIETTQAVGNAIGGTSTGEGNAVLDNSGAGILITTARATSLAAGNLVQSNTISLNDGGGIVLENTAFQTISGGNVITSNGVFATGVGAGIEVRSTDATLAATGNLIVGNFIGTDASAATNAGNAGDGILLAGARNTLIGSALAGDANVINDNRGSGIRIVDGIGGETNILATGNRIRGNTISLNGVIGDPGFAAGVGGVVIDGGSQNVVGGGGAGDGNTISGNRQAGVLIRNAANASYTDGNRIAGNTIDANELDGIVLSRSTFQTIDAGNVVTANGRDGISLAAVSNNNRIYGNRIGMSAAGTVAGNDRDGIRLDGSSGVQIGDVATANRNIVVGNGIGAGGGDGIHLLNKANSASIVNNLVGIDSVGAAVGNTGAGIRVEGGVGTEITGLVIGGSASNAGNVISGNGLSGIVLADTNNALIAGNRIGTNLAGLAAVANGGFGIDIARGMGAAVGGTTAMAANVVSGNARTGIHFNGGTSHSVLGNRIGTNPTATSAIGNQEHGIEIDGSAEVTIGGTAVGSANTIAGNIDDGIRVTLGKATVLGNFIGTNSASGASLANGGDGIQVAGGTETAVGDGTAQGRNVISGNAGRGLYLTGGSTATVTGNYVGTNVAGTAALPNALAGVRIEGATNATIGTTNVISGNAGAGIELVGAATTAASIKGNFIGTNAAGEAAVANGGAGVSLITAGATGAGNQNVIGGLAAGNGNVIAGNTAHGISVTNSTNALVAQNSIGLTASGATLANGGSGIAITNSTAITATYKNQIAANTAYGVLVSGGSGNFIGADSTQTNKGLANGNTITRNKLDGIRIEGGSAGNVVAANTIGALGQGNGGRGITIDTSNGNTIGGTTVGGVAYGNLVVGNTSDGVGILNSVAADLTKGNQLLGNQVRSNLGRGIVLDNSDSQSVGGTNAGEGNTVILNASHGIELRNDSDTNQLVGNFVGTNAAFAQGLGNNASGIRIAGSLSAGNSVRGNRVQGNQFGIQLDGAVGNAVGGATTPDANIVVLQKSHGIAILNGAVQNTVAGNFIGTDASKLTKLGNVGDGINVAGSIGNTIGGDAAAKGNTILFNAFNGVNLVAANAPNLGAGNLVTYNTVSGNRGQGVRLFGSGFNTIGTQDAPNTISQNAGSGVLLSTNSSSNLVEGNTIGGDTAADGNAGSGISVIGGSANTIRANEILRNVAGGISVSGAAATVIGGVAPTDGNTIKSNKSNGILLTGNATLTTIRSNTISGNTLNGIDIERSTGNIVGGVIDGAATGNTITGNGLDGVLVSALSASTVVQSNTIGGDAANRNLGNGIQVARSLGTLVGGTGDFEGNTVSGNRLAGIRVVSVASRSADSATRVFGNTVSNSGEAGIVVSGSTRQIVGGTNAGEANTLDKNSIGIQLIGGTSGTTVSGNVVTGSTTHGISIISSTDNTISSNEIYRNNGNGISVLRSAPRSLATGNRILSNWIGTDAASTTDVGNGGSGIHVAGSTFTTISGNVVGGNAVGVTLAAGATSNLVSANFIGTDAADGKLGNTQSGVDVNGSVGNSVIGNTIELNGIGVRILNATASSTTVGNVVAGNTISKNVAQGVLISGGGKHTIGGTSATSANTISENGGDGIAIRASTGNLVRGNAIDSNKGSGVFVSKSSSNTIGGTIAAAGNTITGNRVGIAIDASARTQAFANLMAGNGDSQPSTGIVLTQNGNQTPATPTFTSATLAGPSSGSLQISGSIGTVSGQTYVVEVFANGTDPANVQAGTFLGRVTIRTGAGGSFSGSILLPASLVVSAGDLLTLTATLATGNTSQIVGPVPLT